MGKLINIGNYSLLCSLAHSLVSFSRSQSYANSCIICCTDSDLALTNFESGLADRLCSLRAGTTSANLNWLIDALAVANSTQSSLRSVIPQLKSHNQAQLQQSLDSTVGLLDVCNALKNAMAEIQDYLGHLQKAVKSLSEAASARSHSYKRLQICLARMEAGNMKRWQNRVEEACISMKLFKKQMPKSIGHFRSVDGATLTTALVLALITSSLITKSAVPNKNTRRNMIPVGKLCIFSTSVTASTSRCWPGPLRDLIQRQLEHAGEVAIFEELESLHLAARDINADVAGVTAAQALLKKVKDMEASVAELRQKLASLFQTVASVRVDSLNVLH